MSPRFSPIAAVALVALSSAASAQTVPGFSVTTYATVTDPVRLAQGLNGELYVGRDLLASGTSTPLKIWRVGAGGSPVVEVGNAPTPDPDVVALDVNGTISGVPGSVLVAGLVNSSLGRISAIHPDGSVATLFESNAWINISAMRFDHAGRLLFSAVDSDAVWVTTGNQPTILAQTPGPSPVWMTVGPDDSIYVSDEVGIVKRYASNGTMLDPLVANFGAFTAIDIAPGGPFGFELYGLRRSDGGLFRVLPRGVLQSVGTGFPTGTAISDILFGACGELYVAIHPQNKLLQIQGPSCACGAVQGADINDDGAVNASDLAILLGAWGTNDCESDFDGDGTVNALDLAVLLGAWS
ncbi:MAG: hypothetical protein JNL80_03820 [Phycisphaerae bacterium]|jgi:hypothetical protein|nr:hypothetical protein [Phycisphaerae bacterium]